MKIAITTEENNLQSLVPFDLQHTNYFLLLETDDIEHFKFIPNMYSKTISGAEIFCSQFLIKQGIEAVICGKKNSQVAQMFLLAGIRIFEMPNTSIIEAIKKLKNEVINTKEVSNESSN